MVTNGLNEKDITTAKRRMTYYLERRWWSWNERFLPLEGAKGPHLIFNLFIHQFFIIYCFCCGFGFDVLNLKGPAGGCEGLSLQISVVCDEAHRDPLPGWPLFYFHSPFRRNAVWSGRVKVCRCLPPLPQQVDGARLLIDEANAATRAAEIVGFSVLFPHSFFFSNANASKKRNSGTLIYRV